MMPRFGGSCAKTTRIANSNMGAMIRHHDMQMKIKRDAFEMEKQMVELRNQEAEKQLALKKEEGLAMERQLALKKEEELAMRQMLEVKSKMMEVDVMAREKDITARKTKHLLFSKSNVKTLTMPAYLVTVRARDIVHLVARAALPDEARIPSPQQHAHPILLGDHTIRHITRHPAFGFVT